MVTCPYFARAVRRRSVGLDVEVFTYSTVQSKYCLREDHPGDPEETRTNTFVTQLLAKADVDLRSATTVRCRYQRRICTTTGGWMDHPSLLHGLGECRAGRMRLTRTPESTVHTYSTANSSKVFYAYDEAAAAYSICLEEHLPTWQGGEGCRPLQ